MNVKDRYSIVDDIGKPCLLLKAPWNKDFLDVLLEKNITCLRLSNVLGWSDSDIDFVKNLDFLTSIEIYCTQIRDLSVLNKLTRLQRLSLDCKFKIAPDFKIFKNLERLFISWVPQVKGVLDSTCLKTLIIDKYPFEDLLPLAEMKQLKELSLWSRKITSLKGIAQLDKLDNLSLSYCTQLEDLTDIVENKLKILEIEACKKVYDISALSNIHTLEKLSLKNCGTIKSLSPLSALNRLRYLNCADGTAFEDGDLHPLEKLNLEEVSFAYRKRYSHKSDDLVKEFDGE